MSTPISDLSTASALAAGDLVPLFSSANGETRKTSLTALAAFLATLLGTAQDSTQYASPNASGFNVAITPPVDGRSVFLILTPLAGYAAGTVTLPLVAVDKQEVIVTCTQAVTALTVAGNGRTVNGAPTTLAANAFFHMRYDGVNNSWYRIG
jgi:hypothetical protein